MEDIKWFSIFGKSDMPLQFFIGGRGIGKTYSGIETIFTKYNCPFYLRTSNQDMVASEIGNPFKAYNKNNETTYGLTYKEKIGMGYLYDDNPANSSMVGYCGALAQLSTVRGLDFEDVDVILYDEFQAEIHRRKTTKNLGVAFANFYETVNRNRELLGKKPVQCYLLSNSISLNNDILIYYDLVKVIQNMLLQGKTRHTIRERGIYIDLCANDISELKENTMLYQSLQGSEFIDEALHNQFINDNMYVVNPKVKIVEYYPYIQLSCYCVYKHKSRDQYHIALKTEKAQLKYSKEQGKAVRIFWGNVYQSRLFLNAITFDNIATKIGFEKLLQMPNII